MRYCFLLSLVLFGCSQNEKRRLDTQRTSGDATGSPTSPTVSADLPPDESLATISVTVQGTATEYKYAFFDNISDSSNCNNDDAYGDFRAISEKLTITEDQMGQNGPKLLCIIGKNDANQGQPQSYRWSKVTKVTPVVDSPDSSAKQEDEDSSAEQEDEDSPDPLADPPAPVLAGTLEVSTSSSQPTKIYFASAAKSFAHITLNNGGGGDLEWRIEAEQPASWLQVGKEKNSLTVVSVANDLVSGTLVAGDETKVWLKLADVYKTDYEAGKKTVTLKVYNVSSEDQPVSITVNMVVPVIKLSVSPVFSDTPEIMRLNGNQPTGKAILNNTRGGDWAVKYQLRHLIGGEALSEFNNVVSYERRKTTDDKHTKYLEFSINQDYLDDQDDDYTASMIYMLITNSSSKGTDSSCGRNEKIEAGTAVTRGGEEFIPEYTTNVCHYIWIGVTK